MLTDYCDFSVTLPQMIAQTNLDPESVAHIRDYVNELLQCVTVYLFLSTKSDQWAK
jgi:hypothetical protein